MGTRREYIEKLKDEWIGKMVIFEDERYNVVDVDYNGMLLIDKKAQYTDTTAVSVSSIDDLMEDSEDEYYTSSCTEHDYGPGNPWDAPGMSIHDFI